MPTTTEPIATQEDLRLVEGLRARSGNAVEAFMSRYRQIFYHCIGQFESDYNQRDDLFQELSLAVLERIDRESFDPNKGSLGTWVYRVAWCKCVDLKRKETTRSAVQNTANEEELPEEADPHSGPGDVASDSEVSELVHSALDRLPGQEKQLLELRFLGGRTLQQVSEQLGLSLETTKYRLRRASDSLRKQLKHSFASAETLE